MTLGQALTILQILNLSLAATFRPELTLLGVL